MKYFSWQSIESPSLDGVVISFYNVSNGEIFLKITVAKEIRHVYVLDEFLPIKDELVNVCMDIYLNSRDTHHVQRLSEHNDDIFLTLSFDNYIRPIYRDIKLKELGIC